MVHPRYDSYRPEYEQNGTHAGGNERDHSHMFWRKDGPAERASGRNAPAPNNSVLADGEGTHSTGQTNGLEVAHKRARSNSEVRHMRIDTSTGSPRKDAPRPNLPPRSSTAVGFQTLTAPQAHPASPITQHFSNMGQYRANSNPIPSAMEAQPITRSTDPRLRNQFFNKMDIAVPSPISTASVATRKHESISQGRLLKELVSITLNRHATEEEYSHLSSHLSRLNSEQQTAAHMFSYKNNAYLEKLKQDVTSTRFAVNAKKSQLEELFKSEEEILMAFSAQNNLHNKLDLDVQDVRKQLSEEQARSRDLGTVNVELQQQLGQMKVSMDFLTRQVQQTLQQTSSQADLQTQISDLKTIVAQNILKSEESERKVEQNLTRITAINDEFTKFQDESLNQIKDQMKLHELGLARLNDFAPQEAIKVLETRLDQLNNKQTSLSAQHAKPFITQAHLDNYVTIFNAFETKTNDRISSLEEQSSKPKPSKHSTPAETDQHTVELAKERNARIQVSEALTQVEAKSRVMEGKLQESTRKLDVLEKDFAAGLQTTNEIYSQARDLNASYQSLRTMVAAKADSQKLQQDLALVRNTIQILDQASKANSHAIDSLNQRCNNITSEHLARHMISIVEPMLATMKPQVLEMYAEFQEIKTQHTSLPDAFKSTEKRMTQVHSAVARMDELHSAMSDRLAKTEESLNDFKEAMREYRALDEVVRSVQTEMVALQTASADLVQNTFDNLESNIESSCKASEAKMKELLASRFDEVRPMMSKMTEDFEEKFSKLVAQVKEARDGIDGRLSVVEEANLKKQPSNTSPLNTETLNSSQEQLDDEPGEPTSVQSNSNHKKISSSVRNSSQGQSCEKDHTQPKLLKVQPDKKRSVQTSPIAKHLKHQSDIDEMSDTIDATPKPESNIKNRKVCQEIISISGSDQEMEFDEDLGERYVNSGFPQPDYDKWIKKPAARKLAQNSNGTCISQTAGEDVASKLKRKRELPVVASRTDRASDISQMSNPQPSKQDKRKAKKTKKL